MRLLMYADVVNEQAHKVIKCQDVLARIYDGETIYGLATYANKNPQALEPRDT